MGKAVDLAAMPVLEWRAMAAIGLEAVCPGVGRRRLLEVVAC